MKKSAILLATAAWLCAAQSLADEKPATETNRLRVVVPGVHAYAGVPAGAADVLADLLLDSLLSRHGLKALGPSDVRALLTAEQQKILLGCTDEACMRELAGAVNADWLVSGSIGKLEDLYVFSLQLIEARAAEVTARASGTLKSLREAPEITGPLVDKLLGARPRREPPSALLQAPAPAPKPAMDVPAFCKKMEAYKQLELKGACSEQLVALRRELLEDLVFTPFLKQFDDKRSCFWSIQGYLEGRLRFRLDIAKAETEAAVGKRCLHEWWQFTDQLQLLEEAYRRGLEMEKNGAGTRLLALPFEVRAAGILVPEQTAEVRAFKAAYAESQKIIEQALRAVQAGNPKAFLGLFAPEDPERGRTSPELVYENLRGSVKNGYSLSACPYFVLQANDVERAADRFAKENLLQCYWRKVKEDFAGSDTAVLRKHGGRWRIDRW